jgi:monoamine oxidase
MSITRRLFLNRVAHVGGSAALFSAMQALGMVPAAASTLPPLPADFGKGKKVVVLGGGVAGLVSAYELRKAGFLPVVLEAAKRPGGRNWTARGGTKVDFLDGTSQTCTFDDGQYFNMGPARIPSIHHNLIGYCRELGVPLEVEINTSRSALMHSPVLNGGKPVTQRRVIHDTRGYIAELLAKAIDQKKLDEAMTPEDLGLMRKFLTDFGALDKSGKYVGGERGGFLVDRGAGPVEAKFNPPLDLHELLLADLSKGEFYEEHIDWQATMFQPVGGMDRIPYAFAKSLGPIVRYGAAVSGITNTARGVSVAYVQDGKPAVVEADFAICTMPVSQIVKLGGNLSKKTKAAAAGIPLMPLYKIAWQAPRFWEKETNIYGGISFLKEEVDLVWYPSWDLFSEKGVVVSGFGIDAEMFGPNPFAKLDTAAKFAASKQSVELLHPGRGNLLEKPLYMSWRQIPYLEGGIAYNEAAEHLPHYTLLNEPDGRVFFAGDWLSRLSGWQEGAILSSHRAIAGISARINAA